MAERAAMLKRKIVRGGDCNYLKKKRQGRKRHHEVLRPEGGKYAMIRSWGDSPRETSRGRREGTQLTCRQSAEGHQKSGTSGRKREQLRCGAITNRHAGSVGRKSLRNTIIHLPETRAGGRDVVDVGCRVLWLRPGESRNRR